MDFKNLRSFKSYLKTLDFWKPQKFLANRKFPANQNVLKPCCTKNWIQLEDAYFM